MLACGGDVVGDVAQVVVQEVPVLVRDLRQARVGLFRVVQEGREVAEDDVEGIDRAVEVDRLPGEPVGVAGSGRGSVEDLALGLVDAVLEVEDDGCVGVHNPVDDGVDDRRGPQGEEPGLGLQLGSDVLEIDLPGVPDGDREAGPAEHVDLTGLDGLRRPVVPGGAEHDEQDVAVGLDLRPLVGDDRVLQGEPGQFEVVRGLPELLLVGRGHADPGEERGVLAHRRACFAEGGGLVHPPAVPVQERAELSGRGTGRRDGVVAAQDHGAFGCGFVHRRSSPGLA